VQHAQENFSQVAGLQAALDFGPAVVGASVVGASVVGASVVGASVVGASVVGASVVVASVVGASVVGGHGSPLHLLYWSQMVLLGQSYPPNSGGMQLLLLNVTPSVPHAEFEHLLHSLH